jgi:hypothetical protein
MTTPERMMVSYLARSMLSRRSARTQRNVDRSVVFLPGRNYLRFVAEPHGECFLWGCEPILTSTRFMTCTHGGEAR